MAEAVRGDTLADLGGQYDSRPGLYWSCVVEVLASVSASERAGAMSADANPRCGEAAASAHSAVSVSRCFGGGRLIEADRW